MTCTPARPDLQAHHDATRLDPAVLVQELRDLLGAKLVAYLGGVEETRAVRQWAEGTRAVSGGEDLHRLRVAYQAARLLAERDSQRGRAGLVPGPEPGAGGPLTRTAAA